ncbi:PorP/SprF family type IX secretion system membrane protein [Chitinophagaceae bacterium LWZ2-11]
MKKISNILLLFVVVLVGSKQVNGQIDPHFSQYYAYPLWLNPALTGAVDGDYRVSANYRNQWSNITNPFSTIGVSGEFVTSKNINIGVNVLDQSAGDGGYHYTTANISVAYTGVKFGTMGYQRLVMGIQGGILNRRFDPNKLQFGEQWNPVTGYNSSMTSGESFTRTSSTVFDVGAGVLFFDGDPGKTANVFLGVSAFHLTMPEDPFVTGTKEKMPIRYVAHGGVRFVLSDAVTLTPNALYMRQGNINETMFGAYAQLKATEVTQLLLGANYRINDAVVPMVGLRYDNLVFGLSYDVNVGKLNNYASASNAYELSISFVGRRMKRMAGENFICPRL